MNFFKFYQKQNLFNGSVLIAKKGQVLIDKGYGFVNVATGKKNDPNGIFQIYSITKTFTSTVILKLVEDNKLALSDKLSKFYPDYPKGDSITIENLLTHTSGIYDYTRGNNMPDQTEKSFVEFEKTKPLDFPVGTDWSYSNSGYYFLGYIIQKVTGLGYEQAVAKYIFNPLQMTQSGFAFKNLSSKNKTIGYEIFTEKIKKPSIVYDPPGPFAAGGIYSTVEDLYKYYEGLKALKILRKETLEKAYTPFKNNYGYGWTIISMLDKKTVGHSGAGAGFRSNFVQIPEDDICIILLSNCEKDLNNVTEGVLKILYDKPYKIPVEIVVKKQTLKKYKGTYQVNDNFIIYVSIENNKLIAQPKGQPKSIMYAEKENLFFVEELNSYIHFEKNKLNQIDTLIFTKEEQDIKAKRIYPSWGIIGSATVNGWDGSNIELTETNKKGIWTINNVQLKDGEIKFRFNNDWTINYGDNNNGSLKFEGDNIKIENGHYDIILDLSDEENPNYKLLKHN
ncbi:MAG: serine hydrolase [Saprospiraceae bacterium]|nr:serine hydrolase [Saprospiraceae bacterium]